MHLPANIRRVLYAAALIASLGLSVLVTLGVVTIEQIEGVALGTAAILGIIAPTLALFNITPDE